MIKVTNERDDVKKSKIKIQKEIEKLNEKISEVERKTKGVEELLIKEYDNKQFFIDVRKAEPE